MLQPAQDAPLEVHHWKSPARHASQGGSSTDVLDAPRPIRRWKRAWPPKVRKASERIAQLPTTQGSCEVLADMVDWEGESERCFTQLIACLGERRLATRAEEVLDYMASVDSACLDNRAYSTLISAYAQVSSQGHRLWVFLHLIGRHMLT